MLFLIKIGIVLVLCVSLKTFRCANVYIFFVF